MFLLTSAGFDTSEGGYDYVIAHQILTKGSLSFSEPLNGIFTVAPNGRTYGSHEIGNALFLLPVAGFNIALEKTLTKGQDTGRVKFVTGFFFSLMPAIYCALATALVYTMLRLFFRKPIASALCGSAAMAFCTFVWTYSRNLFDGVLCMVFLTGAVRARASFCISLLR